RRPPQDRRQYGRVWPTERHHRGSLAVSGDGIEARHQSAVEVAHTDQEPAWLPAALGVITAAKMPANWDSYGSAPVDVALAKAAVRLIARIMTPGMPSPAVLP